jgi:hypothetical protein
MAASLKLRGRRAGGEAPAQQRLANAQSQINHRPNRPKQSKSSYPDCPKCN